MGSSIRPLEGGFWGKGRVMVEMMAEQGRGFLWCCFFVVG